jgi:hypothetical protein
MAVGNRAELWLLIFECLPDLRSNLMGDIFIAQVGFGCGKADPLTLLKTAIRWPLFPACGQR